MSFSLEAEGIDAYIVLVYSETHKYYKDSQNLRKQ